MYSQIHSIYELLAEKSLMTVAQNFNIKKVSGSGSSSGGCSSSSDNSASVPNVQLSGNKANVSRYFHAVYGSHSSQKWKCQLLHKKFDRFCSNDNLVKIIYLKQEQ